MVPVVWYDQLDSTMDEIHRLAAAGSAHGTAVAAATQRAARGRMGRHWGAPLGGCWLSVLVREPKVTTLPPLSPRLGIAVALRLEAEIPRLPRLGLKWPNDIVLGARKLAGVLVEVRWQGDKPAWLAIGLGVNVANQVPAELADVATSVGAVTSPPDPRMMAPGLAAAMIEAATCRDGRLEPMELAEWNNRDILHGRRISTPLPGVAEGINPDGSLRVRQSNGALVLIRTGDVAAAGQPEGE